MSSRVALLRGINVGRGNRIAMADLRDCLTEAGFERVRTLLASGNVIFEAPAAELDQKLADFLHDAVLERFDVDVRVLVLDEAAVAAVVAEHPWKEENSDPSRVLIMLPTDGNIPAEARSLGDREWGRERIFIGEKALHLDCPDGISQSELAKETSRCMGAAVTARNWRTLLRIVDSMQS